MKKKTNVILGDKEKVLYGRDYIEDQLLGKPIESQQSHFIK